MRCSGDIVIGSTIMPDSERFTLSTSAACASIDRLRCTMPMPPFCAMQIAVRCSVTVSIAAEASGMESEISRVNCVETSVRAGTTSEAAGTRRTSSNVRPSRTRLSFMRLPGSRACLGSGSGVPVVAECTTANWGPRVGASV